MMICQLCATLRPHATHWSHMTLSCPGRLVGAHAGFALRFSRVSRIRLTFRMARTSLLESCSHSCLFFVPLLPVEIASSLLLYDAYQYLAECLFCTWCSGAALAVYSRP
eukprot:7873184-Pyramimonas_sp.AAC.1